MILFFTGSDTFTNKFMRLWKSVTTIMKSSLHAMGVMAFAIGQEIGTGIQRGIKANLVMKYAKGQLAGGAITQAEYDQRARYIAAGMPYEARPPSAVPGAQRRADAIMQAGFEKAGRQYMEGVSPERIRQEFLAGLSTAINPVNYLKTLYSFGYLDKIFEGLKVENNFYRLYRLESRRGDRSAIRNPKLVLAWLLHDNDPSLIQERLHALKYPHKSGKGERFKLIENVVFLVNLMKKFSPKRVYEFTRMRESLRPLQGPNTFKNKDIQRHNNEILAWAKIADLNMNEMANFIHFERSVNYADPRLADKAGKEIGIAIRELEASNFQKMMKD